MRCRLPELAALFCLAHAILESVGAAVVSDFDREVAPLLARRCLECHSGADPKGKLDLSRRETAFQGGESGPALVAGKAEESLLVEQIESDAMPPKHPLPASEKQLLRKWVAAGARWGTDTIDPLRVSTGSRAGRDWWSFQPVTRPAPPRVSRPTANPIDAFVLHRLEAVGLSYQPRADRRTLIRRLAFDLTGLPPTPEEAAAFEADLRPDAYERLVDRLLESPRYGVRWARLWLDLARYGESNGFEFDEFRPNSWRYRDWVVGALNRDVPYNEFIRLQVAGDVLRPADPSAVEATGFLVAGAFDTVGQTQQSAAMRKVVRQDEMEDVVGTVGQTFLGLTVQCSRCHDHKFDPVTMTDYYRMSSALSGVRHGERDLSAIDPENVETKRRVESLKCRVAAIEAPAVARLRQASGRKPRGPAPPTPIAAWEFTRGPLDQVGNLHGKAQPGARLDADGLHLDGKTGYLSTPPIGVSLKAKTLEAWVRLADLRQRGGGVIAVQRPDGGAFDAIVFAERETGRWMAGSESHQRTSGFQGPEETTADREDVHVAITYAEDGTVAAYRDGRPYGKPYQTSRPRAFPAGEAQVIFGMRHAPVAAGKMLAGVIVRARLHDRALTASEVAASAEEASSAIPDRDIEALLTPTERAERTRLRAEIDRLRARAAERSRRAYAISPREPETTRVLVRGNPTTPREAVAAGGVACLAGLSAEFGLSTDAKESERRVKLALWLSDPKNPLAPRVIVNRLWQAHFGTGLVDTPSDFGFNGGRPSHPELLDWLASELIARGWSLKAMHRRIVTSEAYRQASRTEPVGLKADASDRLLWRKAPTRLEAEMVRDAMLAVSGALNERQGGPGFAEFSFAKAPGTTAFLYSPVDQAGPEFDRRTLYRSWVRGGRNGFLDAFDCPDPSTSAPRRSVTTTPLQALALLNNALTLRLADRMADRLRREAGGQPERQVELAYRLAFGRSPAGAEREQAARVVTDFGPAVLARAIFNSNEFLYVD